MGSRWIRTFATLGAVALAVAALPVVAVGAGAATTAAITVTPRTGLADHDVVQVSGTAFTPDELGSIQQCAPTLGACLGFSVDAEVDSVGAFSASYEVRRFITWYDGPPIDCAAVECRIVVEQIDSQISRNRILSFDSAAPFDPLPTVTVNPHANLAITQVATVTGIHFRPGEPAGVFECASRSGSLACFRMGTLTADTAGTASGPVTLQRVLRDVGGSATDCADAAVTCSLALHGFNSTLVAMTPITFDATIPVPTMAVEPAGLLPYRSLVTVLGHHLRPSTSYTAVQCYPGTNCGEAAKGTSDATGELRLSVATRRFGFSVDDRGLIPIDCASPGSCPLVLSVTDVPAEELRAQISFDPTAPVPPPPALTVTPSTNLPFRTTVRVTGSGFLANTAVALAQCTTISLLAPCTTTTRTTADGSGHIDAVIPVQRVLSGGLTAIDCSDAANHCIVRSSPAVFPPDLVEFGSAPVSFDPASTPQSPPVTVTPKSGLTDGQTVTVTGSGFAPSTGLGLAMCKAGATFSLLDCEITNPTWFTDDASGGFTHTYDVRAHITTGHGTLDCSVAPRTCALAVVNTNDYSQFSLTPVSFVPETGPTPIVSVVSRAITEPTGTNHSTKVDLVLSEPTDHVVRVSWVAGSGTAISGSDFSYASGTAVFLPGQTRITVRVTVIGDPFDEPNEWFAVNMFSPFGGTLGSNARITILDDDPLPRLRVGSTTVTEGDGTTTARVPISLDVASGRDVAVDFVTHHDTARSGTDYVRTRGRVVIPAGHTTGYIVVPIVGDHIHERSERFSIALNDPVHATIADGEAFVTIHDND